MSTSAERQTAQNKKSSDKTQKSTSTTGLAAINTLLNGRNDYIHALASQYLLTLLNNVAPNSPYAYQICQYAETNLIDDIEGYGFPVKKASVKEDPQSDKSPRIKVQELLEDYVSELDEYEQEELAEILDTAFANAPQAKDTQFYSAKKKRKKVEPEDINLLKKYFQDQIAAYQDATPDPVTENLKTLSDHLGLSDLEKDVLLFIHVVGQHEHLASMIGSAFGFSRDVAEAVIALSLDRTDDFSKIKSMLNEHGPFYNYGLLAEVYNTEMPHLDQVLCEKLSVPDLSKDEIVETLLGKPLTADFTIEDYEHLGEDMKSLALQIQAAIENGDTGANFLIYGPPGTGKTEFVKALVEAIGAEGYVIGENDDEKRRVNMLDADGSTIGTQLVSNNNSPTSQRRMLQLKRAQALLKGNKLAITISDEIEDWLMKGASSGDKPDPDSKVALNRLVENNPVVNICIANDIDNFHESFLQRFDGHLYVGQPPTLVRERMWGLHADRNNVSLNSAELRDLARKYKVQPRQIGKAVRAAARVDGGKDAIEKNLKGSAIATKQTSRGIKTQKPLTAMFDETLLAVTNVSFGHSVDELKDKTLDRVPYALLLQERDGAGADKLLYHMAENASMNVMEYSMAALLADNPMGPPPSEVIKHVFAVAEDRNAYLMITGIEDLAAKHPESEEAWQHGLANVFIDCLRNHNLPVAVTCGDADLKLPRLLTHHFSDHLKMGHLSAEQTQGAFKHYFNMAAPNSFDESELVLSDFENVYQSLRRSGDDKTADDIVEMLNEEHDFRTYRTQFGLVP